MITDDLINTLSRQGITLHLEGDSLKVRGKGNRLSEELWTEITAHKSDLIERLRYSQNPAALEALEQEMAAGKRIVFIRSSVLGGETIACVSDDAILPVDGDGLYNGSVVYRVSELQALEKSRPAPETLRAVHEAKKQAGGQYIGA